MRHWAQEIAKKLRGYWSIDFLADKDGTLWLIDMAEGQKSYRCKAGYQEVPSPALSGDSPSP